MHHDKRHIDIVPDIHADIDRLVYTLSQLGYENKATGWAHPEGRIAAFLGDFIDGGDNNAAVISIVREMERNGHALAIMGNHELNALLYHQTGQNSERTTDGYMRAHTLKNTAQHQTFLEEFPLGADTTRDVLGWFLSLPLFLELDGIRLVHAYWDEANIEIIQARRRNARLQLSDLQELAFEEDSAPFAHAVLATLKGPETALPAGHTFRDLKGHFRTSVRLNWWQPGARTWRNSALSLPSPDDLPDTVIPEDGTIRFYDSAEKPVFFGHYKMKGSPNLSGGNATCLDYPAVACAYRWEGETALRSDHLVILPNRT